MNTIYKSINCIKILIIALTVYSGSAASDMYTEIKVAVRSDHLTPGCLHIPHDRNVAFFQTEIGYVSKKEEPYIFVNYHVQKADNNKIKKETIQELNSEFIPTLPNDIPFCFIANKNFFEKQNQEIFNMKIQDGNKKFWLKFYLYTDLSGDNNKITSLLANFHQSQQPKNLDTNNHSKIIVCIGLVSALIVYILYNHYRS